MGAFIALMVLILGWKSWEIQGDDVLVLIWFARWGNKNAAKNLCECIVVLVGVCVCVYNVHMYEACSGNVNLVPKAKNKQKRLANWCLFRMSKYLSNEAWTFFHLHTPFLFKQRMGFVSHFILFKQNGFDYSENICLFVDVIKIYWIGCVKLFVVVSSSLFFSFANVYVIE